MENLKQLYLKYTADERFALYKNKYIRDLSVWIILFDANTLNPNISKDFNVEDSYLIDPGLVVRVRENLTWEKISSHPDIKSFIPIYYYTAGKDPRHLEYYFLPHQVLDMEDNNVDTFVIPVDPPQTIFEVIESMKPKKVIPNTLTFNAFT